jgi:hypothetical protein
MRLPPRSAASPSTTSRHNTMRGSVESTTSSKSRSCGFVTPCHGLLPSLPPTATQSSARRQGRPSTMCNRPPGLRGGSGQFPADPDAETCVVPCSVVIVPACPQPSVLKHRTARTGRIRECIHRVPPSTALIVRSSRRREPISFRARRRGIERESPCPFGGTLSARAADLRALSIAPLGCGTSNTPTWIRADPSGG